MGCNLFFQWRVVATCNPANSWYRSNSYIGQHTVGPNDRRQLTNSWVLEAPGWITSSFN